MPVHLWWGEEPSDHPSEYAALNELCSAFDSQKEDYYIFANFRVTNAQIDFAIFTNSSIYLIELKHSAGLKVTGGLNGKWIRSDNVILGEKNPVGQILNEYKSFRSMLRKHQMDFLDSKDKAASLIGSPNNTFNDIKKFIVLYPSMHLDSEVNLSAGLNDYQERALIPFLGDVIGFNELASRCSDPSWGRAPLELYQSKVENRRIKEGAKQMKKSRFSEQQVVQILAAGDQGEK
ncbi:NERD domain-containing protein, partial [Candidatus Acetothermia bacterium]|nr:NERD domain-containing protein [Candidatus Acetothermia bacterium]MBI3643005.1 NERD domain-containing protein [Candidatus Acetothermia bacterium]